MADKITKQEYKKMEEKNTSKSTDKKNAEHKHEHSHEQAHDHSHEGHDHSHEDKASESKKVTSTETKVEKVKKTEAVARGLSVRAGKRHCMYICSFIKGKKIDVAIADLEQVIKLKKIVPYKGEVPHRKGKGMMSGRYPVNASKIFIAILKGLRGNVAVNGMDADKTVIVEAYANWAARPQRKGGVKSKRTHVNITAREAKK